MALIGDDLWQRLFDRDSAVIGRTLRLNDVHRTIIGVCLPMRTSEFSRF